MTVAVVVVALLLLLLLVVVACMFLLLMMFVDAAAAADACCCCCNLINNQATKRQNVFTLGGKNNVFTHLERTNNFLYRNNNDDIRVDFLFFLLLDPSFSKDPDFKMQNLKKIKIR